MAYCRAKAGIDDGNAQGEQECLCELNFLEVSVVVNVF